MSTDPQYILASTPSTPAADLAQIAAQRPDLHALVAAHPNAYPALLDWLRAQGDPAVARAIDAREGQSSDAQPAQAEPVQAQPTQVQPSLNQTGQYQTGQYQPIQSQPQQQPTFQQPQPPQQPGYPQQGAAQNWAAAPRAPKPNPFLGIPIADFVREGAALLLLIISLFLPFSLAGVYGGVAATHLAVLLTTILAILSLGATYLYRALWAQSIPIERLWLGRILLVAPYLVVLVIFVILTIIDLFTSSVSGGIGSAFWLGLAAVVVIVLPRQWELNSPKAVETATAAVRPLLLGFLGSVAVFTVLNLIGVVVFLVRYAEPSQVVTTGIVQVIELLIVAVVVAAPAFLLLKRKESSRLLAGAVGAAGVASVIFAAFGNLLTQSEAAHFLLAGAAAVFAPALLAIATSPSVRAFVTPQDKLHSWSETVRLSLFFGGILAGAAALLAIVRLIQAIVVGINPTGFVISLVLALLVSAAGIAASFLYRKDVAGGRLISLAAAAVFLVLGIVYTMVSRFAATTPWSLADLVFTYSLPILIALLTVLPSPLSRLYAERAAWQNSQRPIDPHLVGATVPVEDLFAHTGTVPTQQAPASYSEVVQNGPEQQSAYAQQPYQQAPAQQPQAAQAQTPQPQSAAPSRFTAEQAADPATPAATLQEIAQYAPELRKFVAANPAAYPDLVTWLVSQGDPEVAAAAARRGQ